MYDIRKLREERSMTQKRLAFEAGVDVRTIRRMENGTSVSPESLRAAYVALGIDLACHHKQKEPSLTWCDLSALILRLKNSALAHLSDSLRRRTISTLIALVGIFAVLSYQAYWYAMRPDTGIEVTFNVPCSDKAPWATAFGAMDEAFPAGYLVTERKWGRESCVYGFAAKLGTTRPYLEETEVVREIFARHGVEAATFPLSSATWVKPGGVRF